MQSPGRTVRAIRSSWRRRWRPRARAAVLVACLLAAIVPAVAPAVAFADTAGPRFAGTGANDASTGSAAWANPTNATGAPNNVRAAASLGTNAFSNYLKVTNFGFTIPTDATVNGVRAEIERSQSGSTGNVQDVTVKLIKGGVISGTNKAATGVTWGAGDGGEAYASYGSTSDLWGVSLLPGDVNASSFGLALAVQNTGAANFARVDAVRITITYTPGGGGGGDPTSWTATNYTRTVFQDPANAPYTSWTGLWTNPQDNSLWLAYTQAIDGTGSAAPQWVRDRLGWYNAARDHWGEENTTQYWRLPAGGAWALQKPAGNVDDAMRTWNPAVSSCTSSGTGSNCPTIHPIPFTPQANIALSNGTIVRRVNGEDIKYDTLVQVTAFLQRLTPGGAWGAPEYILDGPSCSCTVQVSRIRRLADGRHIALGQKWDGYNPKNGSSAHLFIALGDSNAQNWTQAITITGGEQFGEDEWDAVELPSGDLFAVFRTSNDLRRQGLLRRNAAGTSWNLDAADVKTTPFTHSGHPELVATSSGAILHIATNDTSAQRGIWYISRTSAQASSNVWTKLPFSIPSGTTTDCSLVSGTTYNCSSRYYPRSFEHCVSGICTIYVASHAGSDDDWWEVDGINQTGYDDDNDGTVDEAGEGHINQAIILQTFRLTSP